MGKLVGTDRERLGTAEDRKTIWRCGLLGRSVWAEQGEGCREGRGHGHILNDISTELQFQVASLRGFVSRYIRGERDDLAFQSGLDPRLTFAFQGSCFRFYCGFKTAVTDVGFGLFMVVRVQAVPHSVLALYRRFGGMCCLHLQGSAVHSATVDKSII